MVRLIADLYARIRHLVPELAKFGVVGGTGAVIDLGGAAVLHSAYHQGPLKAKAISIAAATVVTYLGSRYWTFRHRENQPLLREGTLFFVLNLIGLAIAELVIAFTTYVLVLKGPISYNLASLAGTGLGTIFRYFAYRKWVFLAPAAQPAPAAQTDFAAHPPWNTGPMPPWNAGPTPWNARPAAAPAYAAASPQAFSPHSAPVAAASPAWPGRESPWPQPQPQHLPPSAAQPPSRSRPPAAQPPPWSRPPAVQAPTGSRQPAAQATKAPPRSSGGRHRKPRSA